jgi:hypothetical protein
MTAKLTRRRLDADGLAAKCSNAAWAVHPADWLRYMWCVVSKLHGQPLPVPLWRPQQLGLSCYSNMSACVLTM